MFLQTFEILHERKLIHKTDQLTMNNQDTRRRRRTSPDEAGIPNKKRTTFSQIIRIGNLDFLMDDHNRNPTVIDDQTPMMSPVSTSAKVMHRANIKAELIPILDPDGQDDDPEEGVTYPEPDLFDIKNTIMTEYDLDVLKYGKNNPDEYRRKAEVPDASAPPNKICEFLMYHRTLKELELNQLNSWRTKRNRLSLNLSRGPSNADREFDQKACESLVKKLKDKKHDLQNLIDVVSSKGKKYTGCITIPRTLDGRLQVHGRKGFPHVVYGKLWRFSEMSKNETRHVDHCKHAFEMKTDAVSEVCVNPYHYEIVIGTMIVGDGPRVLDELYRMKRQQSNPPSALPPTPLPHHSGQHHGGSHHPGSHHQLGHHQMPQHTMPHQQMSHHQMPTHQVSPHLQSQIHQMGQSMPLQQHPMHPPQIPMNAMPQHPMPQHPMPQHPLSQHPISQHSIPHHAISQHPQNSVQAPMTSSHQFQSPHGFSNAIASSQSDQNNTGRSIPPPQSMVSGFGFQPPFSSTLNDQYSTHYGQFPATNQMQPILEHQQSLEHQQQAMEHSHHFVNHQPLQPDVAGFPSFEGDPLGAEMNHHFLHMNVGHEPIHFQNEFDRNYFDPNHQELALYDFSAYNAYMSVDDTQFQAPLTPPPANQENDNQKQQNNYSQDLLRNQQRQQEVQTQIDVQHQRQDEIMRQYHEEEQYQQQQSERRAERQRQEQQLKAQKEFEAQQQHQATKKAEAQQQSTSQYQLHELQPHPHTRQLQQHPTPQQRAQLLDESSNQRQDELQLQQPVQNRQGPQTETRSPQQQSQPQSLQQQPGPSQSQQETQPGQQQETQSQQDQQQETPGPPKKDNRISLGMFRLFCKQDFGSRFFGTDEEELCTITDRRGVYLEKPNTTLLGVKHTKRIPKPGKLYKGPWTKDAPYPDMADFILNVSSDTLTTNGNEPPTVKNQIEPWAEIAYYEHKRCLTKRKNIDKGYIIVDGGFLVSDHRFSVGLLENPDRNNAAFKVRIAMMDGIKFSYKEDGSIWLTNFMTYPVFITSGYLDDQSVGMRDNKPHKLYGNSKLKVFGLRRVKQVMRDRFYSRQFAKNFVDGQKTSMNHIFEEMDTDDIYKEARINQDDLTKYCFVRVSFCKGFGEDYPRKTISDTPAWVELKMYNAYTFLDALVSDLQYRFDNLKVNAAHLRSLGLDQSDEETEANGENKDS